MICPLCKSQMHEQWELTESDKFPKFYVCFNEICSFYGVARINKEWFMEFLERE